MNMTHVILTRPNGERIELTVEEARVLHQQLAEMFAEQRPREWYAPMPWMPLPQPAPWPPTWTYGPSTADPLPPGITVTCESRQ